MALWKFSIVVLISTGEGEAADGDNKTEVCVGSRTLVFFCLAYPASSAPRVSLNLPLQVQGTLVSTSLSTRCVPFFGLGCRDMVHHPHLLLLTFLQCSTAKLQQDSLTRPLEGSFATSYMSHLALRPRGQHLRASFISHTSQNSYQRP